MVLGKLDRYMQKKKKKSQWTTLSYLGKIISKRIIGLNVRSETLKLLEENVGSMLFDISLSIFFFSLNMYSQARELNKIKKTMSPHQTQRPLSEWGKIFSKDISDKVLISKIHIYISIHTHICS